MSRIDKNSPYGKMLREERKENIARWFRMSLVFAIVGFFVGVVGSLIYGFLVEGTFIMTVIFPLGGVLAGFLFWWVFVLVIHVYNWAIS